MPLLASHRGVHGRAAGRRTIVENSIQAIDEAVRAGAEMVEIDVRRTLDGVWVLNHDARVGGIPIGRYTYAQLAGTRRGRRGAWPRLDDVARHVAGRVRLDVELKEQGDEAAIGDLLLRHLRPSDFVVTSFLDDVVAAMKRAHPEIRTGLLLGSARPSARAQVQELFPFRRAQRAGADFIAPHASIADSLIPRARRHGLGVVVWTIGREAKLPRYVHDDRVEAVITDRVAEGLALRDGSALDLSEGVGA